MRTPGELLDAFDAGAQGQADVDMRGVLGEIISDVRDSYRTAMLSAGIPERVVVQVDGAVGDYLANNYGDD